jgi:hypothetical protein
MAFPISIPAEEGAELKLILPPGELSCLVE